MVPFSFSLGQVIALSLLLPTVVESFGGLFGHDEVRVTKSSSILGLTKQGPSSQEEEAATEATLHVQIEYESTRSSDVSLGWILPLPAVPTHVHLGSSLHFSTLQNQTQSTLQVEWLDPTVAGALPTDHFPNGNLSYCSQDMLLDQCKRKPDPVSWLMEDDPVMALGKDKTEPSFPLVEVADYFNYELLATAEDVLAWLELHGYVLPHLQSNHTEHNDWWFEQAHWQDLLVDYVQKGTVFMALHLHHQPSNTTTTPQVGRSQPIAIRYPVDDDASIHRLALEMTALTATPDATFDSYWLTPDPQERAVPVNYLDLRLDDRLVDWMACQEDDADCFQTNLNERLHQASQEVHPQTLVTEYAGPFQDVYTPLSVPEGLTVILAASTSWLGFLYKLQTNGIPPIPLVLEIIDEHVPPHSFSAPQWARTGDGGEPPVVEACKKLHHLYEAPQERTMLDDPSTTPTLRECFDMYQPPTSDWVFDAQALASELDNRVFQPYRSAQEWMRSMQSLTRLVGRLDGGEDPYVAMMPRLEDSSIGVVHSNAKAAGVCDNGVPVAMEFATLESSTRDWQPASYSSCEWQAHDQLVLDLQPEDAKSISTAVSATGWDGEQIVRNPETGSFDAARVDGVVQMGEKLVRDVLAGKAVIGRSTDDNRVIAAASVEDNNDSGSSRPSQGINRIPDKEEVSNVEQEGTQAVQSSATTLTLWLGALLALLALLAAL